ncbi:MAG: helix-turn-helix transcriptional regulator [Rhodospirillales bacterium]|nr:helix-turn-helix transcriptional regulator [Rhodospirillales bacterium]
MGWLCMFTPWLLLMTKLAATLQIATAGIAPNQEISLEAQLRHYANPPLTDREVQVAMLMLAGDSTKAIAIRLSISPETVKVHRRNLYEKLGVSSQVEIFTIFMIRK